MRFSIISAGVVAGMLVAGGAQARDQISIVGSLQSTHLRPSLLKIWSIKRVQNPGD